MTITNLKEKGLIVFEAVCGSHAYGLDTPESDMDVKGVFVLPQDVFYGLETIEQVSDERNDTVYYELRRFMELLARSNPNILELLHSPKDCVRLIHPVFAPVLSHHFLSKACEKSFGSYAMTQVKKARGLNKKILNPMDKEKQSVIDFCYVAQGQGAIGLRDFLRQKGWDLSDCGVSRISHMPETYGLYHQPGLYKGLVHKAEANELALSSIPKDAEPAGIMTFNQPAYTTYCKEYKEYWEWTRKRNDVRYENTLSHGKNYDSKNMMHTIRLLTMAEEIGKTGQLLVRRPDREYLLQIKGGEYTYETLLEIAEQKSAQIKKAFLQSSLPDQPDVELIDQLLIETRKRFYRSGQY